MKLLLYLNKEEHKQESCYYHYYRLQVFYENLFKLQPMSTRLQHDLFLWEKFDMSS